MIVWKHIFKVKVGPGDAHLVLLHLVLDVLQVGTKRLSADLLDASLCDVQPLGELLQLLVLQLHQDFMESGTETNQKPVSYAAGLDIPKAVFLRSGLEIRQMAGFKVEAGDFR